MASRRQVALENSAKIDLGKLPSLWERALLVDVSELQCGYAFKSKWFSDSGIKLLRGTNIIPGGLRWEDIAYLPEERVLEFNDYRLEKDDIVIAMDRPLISSGLKIARLSEEDLPALLLQRVGRFKMTQAMLSDYLLIFLRSWIFITHIGGQATGTQLPHISATDIKTAPIPLPPLNEQHRIVAKIEALTTRSRKARAALDAIPALLDQFRQSVLAAAFRGDLTADWRAQNPDVEPAETLLERIRAERRTRWEAAELEKMNAKGKVPKNDKWKEKYKEPLDFDTPYLPELHSSWTWMSADECTSLITDGEHATPKRTSEGVYLLSARNVLNGEISLKKVDYISEELHQKLNQRLQLQPGDVLLSCSGTVGRSCTVPKGLECSFVRSVAILKPLFEMGEYLSLSIRSPVVQSQIDRKKTQTAQSNLFQGRIKVLAFPLSPLAEQKEILRRITAFMTIADTIERQYSEIVVEQTQLDQSILAKAFRGQLVPQDPSDEPASVLLERIRTEREKTQKKKRKGKAKK